MPKKQVRLAAQKSVEAEETLALIMECVARANDDVSSDGTRCQLKDFIINLSYCEVIDRQTTLRAC
jgi:hypothetical protein